MRPKIHLISCFLLVLILGFHLGGPAQAQRAQQGAGNIQGTVTDASGGVIPGVDVTARNVATGIERMSVSNDSGYYLIQALGIGEYEVTGGLTGFKTKVVTRQRITSDTTRTVNIVLEVGDVTETVTVAGQATLIKTTDTTVAHAQDSEVLEVLPVHMSFFVRQSMVLINTLPGVIFKPTWDGNKGTIHGVGDNGPQRNPIGYNTDGHQSSINWHQGLRDETGPAPELIEEFRIETNQDAEKGFNSGVSVEMITKSGTNEFHGSGFLFHRNDILDARRWTASSKGDQIQNEWGFILGGPIVKDKAFFMMNYTGYEWSTQPSGRIGTVQTELMRSGNFNEVLGPSLGTDVMGREVRAGMIYDPLTTRPDGQGGFLRDPFPNNTIPASRIGGVAKHLMTAYPGPNRPGGGLTNNYEGEGSDTFDIDKVYLKTDIEHEDHKVTIGYEDTPNMKLSFLSPANRLNSVAVESRGVRVRLNHLWTVSPSLLFSTRLGINRITYGEGKLPPASDHCPGGCVQGALTTAIPRLRIQSAVGGGFGDNTDTASHFQSTVPVFMDLSWTSGNHNVKVGAQLSIWAGRFLVENHTAGTYTFRNRTSGLPGFPSTGDGFASFLMGDVDEVLQETASARKVTSYSWAFYVQDSWRTTPKLTINYGLRWEIPIPFHESYRRWGLMDIHTPNPEAGGLPGALTFYGEGEGRNGRVRAFNVGFRSLGPRLGLAYQLNDKTVARGYYGLMYFPLNGEMGNGAGMPNQGFGASVTATTPDFGLTPALNWDQGINILPTNLPFLNPSLINGSSVGFVDVNETQQGTAQRMGLAIERELPWDMVFTAEYIGLLGHGVVGTQIARYNQLPLSYLGLGNLLLQDIDSQAARDAGYTRPYPGFTGTVGQSLRRFPQYNWVAQLNSHSGYNLYHSAILILQKRFSTGLNFMLSHTIAKSLTSGDVAERGSFAPRAGSSLQHWDTWSSSKTLVPFNRSWATKASFSWELPFGRGKTFGGGVGRLGNLLVGGWRVAGHIVYHAGNPLTVGTGQFLPYMGPAWAVWNHGVKPTTGVSCGDFDPNQPGRDRIFNPAAFSSAANFTLGNFRVHPSAQNCGFMQDDISLMKDFQISEGVSFRFAAEMFNAFNRVNWRGAGSNVDSPQGFGKIGNTLDPRIIQLYWKINF